MGEAQHGVLPCAPGGVAGEAVVEHVDEADLRVPLQRVLDRRRCDCFVVAGSDLPDGFESNDPVGKPSISWIIALLQPASPADASFSPAFSSFAEALSIWAIEVRIASVSVLATASAPSCS